MASYPVITTLSGLDGSPGLNNPADADSASELAASIRQVKAFLSTYLGVSHDDTGLVDTGVISTAGLADLSVTTAKLAANAVTAAKITNATITTTQIAAATLLGSNMVNGTVGSTQLADGGVTTVKITDLNVTTGKIADLGVTTAKIAALAVDSSKIAALGVINGKLAANAVSKDKLSNAGEGKIYVGDGTAMEECTVGGALTMTRVGTVATFAVAGGGTSGALAFARLIETVASGTSGGATTAGAWENRGSTVPWDDSGQDPGGMVTIATPYFQLPIGSYYIRAIVPGYSCGTFKTRLLKDPTGTPTTLLLGSNATAPAGATGVSFISGLFSIVAATNFAIQQYSEFAEAQGMGLTQSIATFNENYAVVELIKYA